MDQKKIGKFIAELRKEKHLTQEQLGEKLGVTNKTISRWENGNYMPDLSLLEPLSRILEISLNELLAGERLQKENIEQYSEENIMNTIDYTTKEISKERKKISIFIMGLGAFIVLCSFVICEAESSWTSIYSIIGAFLLCIGIGKELKLKSLLKRVGITLLIFILLLSGFHILDYIGVVAYKRPPIYRYISEAYFGETNVIIYRNLFYDVYRINTDTPNEYYIIDNKKEYTLETVPLSPFNHEKSGIDSIEKYKSDYIGDNVNTGMLISHLPLCEYGYVFEIDSKKNGLTINYHSTDWYMNDRLYLEKSLIYNSVSIFALIDNVQYIQYHFSGSSYTITRDDLENNYPNYQKLFDKKELNKDNFNQYVEEKMNDSSFVQSVFSIFQSQ